MENFFYTRLNLEKIYFFRKIVISTFTGVIYYFLMLYDCATLVPISRIVSFTKQYIITQENAIVKNREHSREEKLNFSGRGLSFPQKFSHICLAQVISPQNNLVTPRVPKVKLPTSRTLKVVIFRGKFNEIERQKCNKLDHCNYR